MTRSRSSQWRGNSNRWFQQRPRGKRRKSALPSLTSIDFKARVKSEQWQRLATPMIVLGLALGLGLTMLRTEIVRMKYDLATAGSQETQLLDQQRRLTVEQRKLLDPGRLGRIAKQRGFVRPSQVLDVQGDGRIQVAVRADRP